MAEVQVDASPKPTSGTADWYRNPDCRLVFFATLEGLYEDGIPTEAVDLIVGKESKASNPVKHDFVFYCKLCHAVYEAFVLYQRRQTFNATEVDTFQQGALAPALLDRLKSPEARTRVYAMGELVQPWIKRKLLAMDMNDAEKRALMTRLLNLVAEGKEFLDDHRRNDPEYGDDWMFYGACQACEAVKTVSEMLEQN